MGRPKRSKNKKNIYQIYLCKLLGCFEKEYKEQYCKKHEYRLVDLVEQKTKRDLSKQKLEKDLLVFFKIIAFLFVISFTTIGVFFSLDFVSVVGGIFGSVFISLCLVALTQADEL